MTGKKLLKFISLTLLFVIIIGYGIWKGRDLLFGIKLTVSGIENNQTTKNPIINLTGVAYHAISITINERTVSIEQNGDWHDTIALLNGYNIITISAKDKFGRTISKTYTINYKAPPDTIPRTYTPPKTETTTSTDNQLLNNQ